MLQPNRKKKIERHYAAEALRACSVFPVGRLVSHERPDFLLLGKHGMLGIEVTELCRQRPRAEAARLLKVPDKAKALYDRFLNADPVNVSVAFFRAQNVSSSDLAKSLADFVYANRTHRGAGLERDLPRGYCHIGIHDPLSLGGRWQGVRSFDTVLASKELLEARISEKNCRVEDYRLSAPVVWLLIVNDHFLGPGEVYARPDHVSSWKLSFDFDKVLLFCREPGGTGEVIEIQRK